MRWLTAASYAVGAILLAFLYYWLVVQIVGYAAVVPRTGWWMNAAPTIGRRAAAVAWLEAMNTGAMIVAATPVALLGAYAYPRRAMGVVALAAAAAATYALAPTFRSDIWPLLHGFALWVTVIDAIKMAVLPPLLTWIVSGPISNTPCRPNGPSRA